MKTILDRHHVHSIRYLRFYYYYTLDTLLSVLLLINVKHC